MTARANLLAATMPERLTALGAAKAREEEAQLRFEQICARELLGDAD